LQRVIRSSMMIGQPSESL